MARRRPSSGGGAAALAKYFLLVWAVALGALGFGLACLVPMTSALGSFGGSLGPLMAVVGAILLSILYVDWVVLRAATLEDGFWNFQKSLGDDTGVPVDPSGGKKE